MLNEYPPVYDRYRERKDLLSLVPLEFYRLARSEGVSKYFACLLLRDLFSHSLAECLRVIRASGEELPDSFKDIE